MKKSELDKVVDALEIEKAILERAIAKIKEQQTKPRAKSGRKKAEKAEQPRLVDRAAGA